MTAPVRWVVGRDVRGELREAVDGARHGDEIVVPTVDAHLRARGLLRLVGKTGVAVVVASEDRSRTSAPTGYEQWR